MTRLLPILTLLLGAASAQADSPVIESASATYIGMGWRFDVTLRHPDTGWDHYADGWEIVDAEGNQLAIRKLYHPHETEQPFTRSLNSVMLPDGIQVVYVRARCSVEGWTGEPVELRLDPTQ